MEVVTNTSSIQKPFDGGYFEFTNLGDLKFYFRPSKKEELPIHPFIPDIIGTILKNDVTIIVGGTGSGKTTQVVKELLREGLKTVCTQPRRIAAATVASRVAEELKTEVGEIIGYKTANPKDSQFSDKCLGLYVTDGLALAEILSKEDLSYIDVLVIDEVHERNANIECLMAYLKYLKEKGKHVPKLVFMSATMEADNLSEYWNNAPVINVPGRQFPIEEIKSSGYITQDIAGQVKAGRNVLVFLPGKREISQLKSVLIDMGLDIELMELHREVQPSDQGRCFQTYNRPKVVLATDIAETSLTIPDIDTVIVTGECRVRRIVNGIEGLFKETISQFKFLQQIGRCGRTKKGFFINCGPAFENLRKSIEPELERIPLCQKALMFLKKGIHPKKIPFLCKIKPRAFDEAIGKLRFLKLVQNSKDQFPKVTKLGDQVATLPLPVELGIMLVKSIESHEKSKTNPNITDPLAEALIACACIQAGCINERLQLGQELIDQKWFKNFCLSENKSDVSAQIKIFKGFIAKLREAGIFDFSNIPSSFFKDFQISEQRFYQALDNMNMLIKHMEYRGIIVSEQYLERSVPSGSLDLVNAYFAIGFAQNIYTPVIIHNKLYFQHAVSKETPLQDPHLRELALDTVLANGSFHPSRVVVGIPLTLERKDGGERHILRFCVSFKKKSLNNVDIDTRKSLTLEPRISYRTRHSGRGPKTKIKYRKKIKKHY